MADGRTNLQFTANKATGAFELVTYSRGQAIASVKFDLNEAADFTVKMAKAVDECARARHSVAPSLIIPESVASLPRA